MDDISRSWNEHRRSASSLIRRFSPYEHRRCYIEFTKWTYRNLTRWGYIERAKRAYHVREANIYLSSPLEENYLFCFYLFLSPLLLYYNIWSVPLLSHPCPTLFGTLFGTFGTGLGTIGTYSGTNGTSSGTNGTRFGAIVTHFGAGKRRSVADTAILRLVQNSQIPRRLFYLYQIYFKKRGERGKTTPLLFAAFHLDSMV